MDERKVVSLDLLPVKVIGNILSHVGSARQVAQASTTCRKWRDAVYHLHRLTFDTSDFPNAMRSHEDSEMIITEAILKTTSLSELSIGAMDNVPIHGASLMAWLLYTKKTLKSLSLTAQATTQVDILRMLAGKDGALEHLVWRPLYVPRLEPAMHNLPFLVSLTLDSVTEAMNWRYLQILLSAFPRLESLCLSTLSIEGAPAAVELHIPLSLQTLKMHMIHFRPSIWKPKSTSTTLVLYADNLERLSLSNVVSEGVAFDIRQINGLKDLVLQNVNLTCLKLREDLQHLVLADAHCLQVDTGNLVSLRSLMLSTTGDLESMWPIYLQIIVNVSSKLSSLQLLGGLPTDAALDMEIILLLFPCLRWLALDYQHVIFGDLPENSEVWKQLVDLELHTAVKGTNPKLFAHWTVKILEYCPKLQRLVITIHAGDDDTSEFLSRLGFLQGHLMTTFQHIDFDLQIA